MTISIRAVSGLDRISDEIDCSVLNRKCGLIWLASASIRAVISSFSCSCSLCSMRALFQILIGMATHSVVSSTASAVISGSLARNTKMRPGQRWPIAWRSSSRRIGGVMRMICQSIWKRRSSRHA